MCENKQTKTVSLVIIIYIYQEVKLGAVHLYWFLALAHYGLIVRKANAENFSPRGGSEPALIFVALMMSIPQKGEEPQKEAIK